MDDKSPIIIPHWLAVLLTLQMNRIPSTRQGLLPRLAIANPHLQIQILRLLPITRASILLRFSIHPILNTHSYDTYLNDPTNQDERNPFRNPIEHTGYNQSIPLAAPRPGYAAPVAALNLARPSPVATPDGRMLDMGTPIPIGVPNTPHPLQAPLTPIAPVFARPSVAPCPKDVKFEEQKPLIMRGDKEETLLPKRGEKGDDFWRRFSVVVKEETKAQHKPR